MLDRQYGSHPGLPRDSLSNEVGNVRGRSGRMKRIPDTENIWISTSSPARSFLFPLHDVLYISSRSLQQLHCPHILFKSHYTSRRCQQRSFHSFHHSPETFPQKKPQNALHTHPPRLLEPSPRNTLPPPQG